ncbi:hypothetical protein L9F63_020564, partial [Diploptera punctata]
LHGYVYANVHTLYKRANSPLRFVNFIICIGMTVEFQYALFVEVRLWYAHDSSPVTIPSRKSCPCAVYR